MSKKNTHAFPIAPYLETRKADCETTGGFYFKWLFFTAWTLDTPSFEIGLAANAQMGIGVIGTLPYIRWAAAFPCPRIIDDFTDKYLRRNPKKPKDGLFGTVAVISYDYKEFELFKRSYKHAHRHEIDKGGFKYPIFVAVHSEKALMGRFFDSVAFTDKWKDNKDAVNARDYLEFRQPKLFN